MADYRILQGLRSSGDYRKENEALEMDKQLKQAQIQKAQADAQFMDVDKLGEQALFKSIQGHELSPQEEAAAKYVSAKSGGVAFDPVTGSMYQKPNIASQLGINFGGADPTRPATSQGWQPLGDSGQAPNYAPQEQPLPFDFDPTNEWDVQFKRTYDAVANNPKLQQSLALDYNKAKSTMTEAEAKAAGFADRTIITEPTLEDPNVVKELGSRWERFKAGVPVVGNSWVSNDYQAGEQAQRDFINSLLRRESGAVISDSEFDNARKQYFPQPGDTAPTLAQKKANRDTAIKGLQRSAGPAYKKPTTPAASEPTLPPLTNQIDGGGLALPTFGEAGAIVPPNFMGGQGGYTPQKPGATPAYQAPSKIRSIPMDAAKELKANPQTREQFDAIFGKGAAKTILGK